MLHPVIIIATAIIAAGVTAIGIVQYARCRWKGRMRSSTRDLAEALDARDGEEEGKRQHLLETQRFQAMQAAIEEQHADFNAKADNDW